MTSSLWKPRDGACPVNPTELFSMYMQVTGVPSLEPPQALDARLFGKKLGVINAGTWTSLWSNYFGKLVIPEVQFVNVGNEAIQLNFMRAHHDGLPCPPERNIEIFAEYARQLVELVGVDAILISCSTMNRSFPRVEEAVREYGVPVIQIDLPMMEKAVEIGQRVLVVATHGPTVDSTRKLLEEAASKVNKTVSVSGVTVESAFELLGEGRIEEHNRVLAEAIKGVLAKEKIDVVVLAQLSMTVFKFTYPESEKEFGVPVLTSGEEGFRRAREVLLSL